MEDKKSQREPQRCVVTGGPSVGKQAVFEVLQSRGFACTEGEPAREIYRKFKDQLGRHLKVGDRREYSSEVLAAFIEEYCAHKNNLRFYNRGILVLSRICAAPSARLSHLALEGQGAFASQC